jgi:hypothetical protein
MEGVLGFYRADLVTEHVPHARTLAATLLQDDADLVGALASTGGLARDVAHAGVVHADLNASNVLLDEERRPVGARPRSRAEARRAERPCGSTACSRAWSAHYGSWSRRTDGTSRASNASALRGGLRRAMTARAPGAEGASGWAGPPPPRDLHRHAVGDRGRDARAACRERAQASVAGEPHHVDHAAGASRARRGPPGDRRASSSSGAVAAWAPGGATGSSCGASPAVASTCFWACRST